MKMTFYYIIDDTTHKIFYLIEFCEDKVYKNKQN